MKNHGTAATALLVTTAAIAIGMPATASACSPPVIFNYDARLSMNVVPDAPGMLAPGATGRLEFLVDLVQSPTTALIPVSIRTRGTGTPIQGLPSGPMQPLRLSADPGSSCIFGEHSLPGPSGPTYFYSVAANVSLQTPLRQCSVRYEVLPAAMQSQQLTFDAGTFNANSCVSHRDLVPADNAATLIYGGLPSQPVPVGGRPLWTLLALALLAVATPRLSTKRRATSGLS